MPQRAIQIQATNGGANSILQAYTQAAQLAATERRNRRDPLALAANILNLANSGVGLLNNSFRAIDSFNDISRNEDESDAVVRQRLARAQAVENQDARATELQPLKVQEQQAVVDLRRQQEATSQASEQRTRQDTAFDAQLRPEQVRAARARANAAQAGAASAVIENAVNVSAFNTDQSQATLESLKSVNDLNEAKLNNKAAIQAELNRAFNLEAQQADPFTRTDLLLDPKNSRFLRENQSEAKNLLRITKGELETSIEDPTIDPSERARARKRIKRINSFFGLTPAKSSSKRPTNAFDKTSTQILEEAEILVPEIRDIDFGEITRERDRFTGEIIFKAGDRTLPVPKDFTEEFSRAIDLKTNPNSTPVLPSIDIEKSQAVGSKFLRE